MNSQQELLDAINTITQSKDRSCDTPATVLRVEGDTVWVHIDGGADETPVQKTINCSEGEIVQVRISNGSAFLVGNASAPPTDDTTANVAHFVAEQADVKATEAIKTANAIVQTVQGKVDSGDSNVTDLSSTMYQDAYGVNIYNDTLAVGDSYAHIDGDSFDIKQATTAGTIDNVNDTLYASFGREVTVGTRLAGSTVGDYSQVFGFESTASGSYAHAEGYGTTASKAASHAEGYYTTASGVYSHAEGFGATASEQSSHAEGDRTTASGNASHAEGYGTKASGGYSHAEGNNTKASGDASHAEGNSTKASGNASHAEGYETTASGYYAHSQNYQTLADSDYQTAIGKYNVSDNTGAYALIIGNGTAFTRSDALRVKWDGSVIDGNGNKISPTILTSSTISASTTSYTFSDASITTDSVIDIYDTIFGFSPTGMTVSTGSCTITFSAQSSTHTIKLFVY